MPPTKDYLPVVRGPLKLKGSGLGGIQKPKKKKKKSKNKSPDKESNHNEGGVDTSLSTIHSNNLGKPNNVNDDENLDGKSNISAIKGEGEILNESIDEDQPSGKTASELAFEQMRKKRLIDRLAKEGLKTHKQRVEELNKYLSNLSEHHDMPRIGPG